MIIKNLTKISVNSNPGTPRNSDYEKKEIKNKSASDEKKKKSSSSSSSSSSEESKKKKVIKNKSNSDEDKAKGLIIYLKYYFTL